MVSNNMFENKHFLHFEFESIFFTMKLPTITILIFTIIILLDIVNGILYNNHGRTLREKCLPKKKHRTVYETYPVYKNVPVYKYEKYPVEVPVKVPVYISMKKPYEPSRSRRYGQNDHYDHEYHGSDMIRGNYGRRFGQLGFGEQFPSGRYRFNSNQYDDSDYRKKA